MAGQRIGFIGTGSMGGPMVLHLLAAGHPVIACDKRAEALATLRDAGAEIAPSVRAVADAAEIVFACLPSREVSLDVALGLAGISGGGAVKIYIEMSTIGTAAMRQIATGLGERGIIVIDAPVSGGRRGAEERTISTIVAGPHDAFEAIRPFLSAISNTVFHVGEEPGLGQACKLVNNAISITGAAIAYEAVVIGVKAGLDASLLIDVINASTGRNSATVSKFPNAILPRRFNSGAAIDVLAKDIALYLEEAKRLDVPTWIGSSVEQLCRFAHIQGAGQQDGTSLIRFYEEWAGVEVKGRS
jgi:3-hydroxyisobutyrate dehydrogenase-like beta-hydroxyacid dehydrogenase